MAQAPSRGPQPGAPQAPSPDPTRSRRMLLLLGLMLAGVWFWKGQAERSANPPVPYSQLYTWVDQGKVRVVRC